MIYRGSEVVREVAFVVFDEVHYVRGAERGVVWEESIVLVPHRPGCDVSATIECGEFAQWVAKSIHSLAMSCTRTIVTIATLYVPCWRRGCFPGCR